MVYGNEKGASIMQKKTDQAASMKMHIWFLAGKVTVTTVFS